MTDTLIASAPPHPKFRAGKLAASVAAALPGAARTALTSLGIAIGAIGLGASSAAHANNTYYVTTAGDPGPVESLSLRQAIAVAGDLDIIRFDASLVGSTITLAQGALAVTKPLQIYGLPDAAKVTISGNNADRVFHASANLTLINMRLTQGNSDGCGGAVYVQNAALGMDSVTITDSIAASGGGVCVVGTDSSVALFRTRLSGNSARLGGGMYLGSAGSFFIQDSSISGNSALRAGGGMYVAGTAGPSNVRRSLIAGNTVPAPIQYSYPSHGGGIVLSGIANVYVEASTFAGNSAYGAGGAVRILGATSSTNTTMRNVTIAGNTSGSGGAVSSSEGAPTITSSIVAGNSGGDLAGTFTANYSLIGKLVGAQITGNQNLFNADPMLGPLADHGGPTRSMVPASGSPVINAGGSALPGIPRDQRYFLFVGTKDIGAVERQNPEPIIFRDGLEPEL